MIVCRHFTTSACADVASPPMASIAAPSVALLENLIVTLLGFRAAFASVGRGLGRHPSRRAKIAEKTRDHALLYRDVSMKNGLEALADARADHLRRCRAAP